MLSIDSDIGDYFRSHSITTSILSAILGGSFAAIVTHPVDTAKTCVQSDLEGNKFSGKLEVAGDCITNMGLDEPSFELLTTLENYENNFAAKI